MGFNIDGFKKMVEEAFQQRGMKTGSSVDNSLDIFEKASLFNNSQWLQQIATAAEKGEITDAQIKQELGIELSTVKEKIVEQTNTNVAGARRAAGSNGGDGNAHVTIVESGGTLIINIDNSSNWQLTVNITADLEGMVKQLIDAFKEGADSINNNNTELVQKLMDYFHNEQNSAETRLFSFLTAMFDGLRKDGDMQLEALMAIIDALNNIGIKIDGAAQMINDTLKSQFEVLKKLLKSNNEKLDKLIELVEQNNATQEDQNKMLAHILDAIKSINGKLENLSNTQKEQLNTIIGMLGENGANFEKVIALLEAIRVAEGDNKTWLKNIYDAVKEGNEALINLLTDINVKFSKYGDEVLAKLFEIANKEIKVDVNVDIGDLTPMFEAILAKLSSIDNHTGNIEENQQKNQEYMEAILNAIDKLGVNVTASLSTIIENMGDDTAKLDKLISLLEQLDANNTAQNQAILDAIAKLGIDMADGFNKLVEIGIENNSLTQKTNELIEALTTYINEHPWGQGGGGGVIDVNALAEAVAKAIAEGVGDIAGKMDDMIALLQNINNNVVAGNEQNKELGNKILEAINKLGLDVAANMNTIIENLGGDSEKLQAILDLLGEFKAENAEQNKAILEALAGLGLKIDNVAETLKNLNITLDAENLDVNINMQPVIDAINNVGLALSSQLTDILDFLGEMKGEQIEIKNVVRNIFTKIAEGGGAEPGSADYSAQITEILTVLNLILQAIKDHNINITITVKDDGQLEIDCPEAEVVHEGEQNGNDAMGARAFRAPSSDGNPTHETLELVDGKIKESDLKRMAAALGATLNITNGDASGIQTVTLMNGKEFKTGKYTGQAINALRQAGYPIPKTVMLVIVDPDGKVHDLKGVEYK